MEKQFLFFFFFFSLICQSSYAQIDVEQHPILTDRFIINAGLFSPLKTIKIGANGETPNKEIDFDEAFDFNRRESTLALNFVWRFAKKWHLATEYFSVKSSHEVVLEEEIHWEDEIYKVGASVEGGFRINMYRIFVGRVISSGIRHEFGGGLGVHAIDFNTYIQLKASASIDDIGSIDGERRSVTALAPLPNIGFWYYYTPNTKWALTARLDWFGITIGEYSGSLWNVAPGIKYQIFKNFGIGVNYRYFKTTLKVDKTNWNGSVNVIFQGPLFTVSANF